jgi:hypothetical protein
MKRGLGDGWAEKVQALVQARMAEGTRATISGWCGSAGGALLLAYGTLTRGSGSAIVRGWTRGIDNLYGSGYRPDVIDAIAYEHRSKTVL